MIDSDNAIHDFWTLRRWPPLQDVGVKQILVETLNNLAHE